jgi:hypothetical protein
MRPAVVDIRHRSTRTSQVVASRVRDRLLPFYNPRH